MWQGVMRDDSWAGEGSYGVKGDRRERGRGERDERRMEIGRERDRRCVMIFGRKGRWESKNGDGK